MIPSRTLMRSRFVVVATGARTPVGLRAVTTATATYAGIRRHRLHPTLRDGAGEPLRFGLDDRLDPALFGTPRAEALALTALQECLEPLAPLGSVRLSLWVGVPEERPGWSRLDTELVLRTLTQELCHHARPDSVTGVTRGHAAGLCALEQALRELDAGRTHACVIGGVDTYLHPATLDWLDRSHRLASTRTRSGFVPGEAAGFVLVTTDTTARAWQLPVLAIVRGVATTLEPTPLGSEHPRTGEALTAAIAGATQSLRLPEEKLATTYCDLNGERWRSEEFLYVPLRLHAPFVDANRYETSVDAWGDVGAASGPLHLVLAVVSGQRRYADGSHVLVWAASDGGTRAAATLELPTHAKDEA